MTTSHEQPAERVARAAVMRMIWTLSRKDQIRVYNDVLQYLERETDAPVPRISKERQEREDMLGAVRAVAEHLGLIDRAPTVAEFDQASTKLGLGIRSGVVIRVWGRWRFVGHALLDINKRQSPAQRELQRRTSGRKRNNEQFLTGVREWLDTDPDSTRMTDYDNYTAQANDEGREPPLVTAGAVKMGLNLSWETALRIAGGKTNLSDEYLSKQREIIDRTDPLRLVTIPETALLLGVHRRVADNLRRDPDGPTVVGNIGNGDVFYKEDVLAYRNGEPLPVHLEGEIQNVVWDGTQIAHLLGIKASSLPSYRQARMFHKVPEHSGEVGNRYYWLREDVRKWAATYRPDLTAGGRL